MLTVETVCQSARIANQYFQTLHLGATAFIMPLSVVIQKRVVSLFYERGVMVPMSLMMVKN
ncbi:hypothetical protein O9929_17565 [Vibrio lentus]|nr:hypothetical protein [Vibrio lentus]